MSLDHLLVGVPPGDHP